MLPRAFVTASAVALAAVLAAPAANALQINDLFDSSITTDPNAAQIESTIQASTGQIAALYGDHAKVTILFRQAKGDFLGSTQYTIYGWDTADYNGFSAIDALAHPDNAPLWSGLTSVFAGNVYPNNNLLVSGADLRALGLTSIRGAFDKSGTLTGNGDVDAVITLTTTYTLNYGGVMPPYDGTNEQYSAQNTIQHEVDEVLGGGGAGSNLNNVYFLKHGGTFGDPATDDFVLNAVSPLDRFRYGAPGQINFLTGTGVNAQSYYSLDGGVTDIIDFNQYHQGDYGDFGPTTTPCSVGGHGGPAGVIQAAFECNNQPTIGFSQGSVEDVMLQSIGWDHSVVPEPAGWAMMIVGLGGVGALLRRKPRPAAAA
jgi:hypothetical protein